MKKNSFTVPLLSKVACIIDPIWNIDLRNWHICLQKFEPKLSVPAAIVVGLQISSLFNSLM
jgi:hypothetical protein